jgi:broad specificity phosphatase PhoE
VSELLIVRHGQATVGVGDYDQLSERGWEQSRRLGAWLLAHHPDGFAHVVTGEMRRHKETLAAIHEAYEQAGRALCAPRVHGALNEFDHDAGAAGVPQAQGGSPAAGPLDFDRKADPRALFRALRAGLLAWSEGELEEELAEGWTAFSARVAQGAEELRALADPGAPTLVVTSGGVIAQLARRALGLTPAATVNLNLTIRNSALSEFRSFDGTLGILSWNTLPHLAGAADRALWTHY